MKDFADGEVAVGNLRGDLVPSWDKPELVQELVVQKPRPKPRKTHAAGEDVAMVSDAGTPEPSQLSSKGKGRDEGAGKGSSSRSRSKQKRGFQDSPSKAHSDAKRARKDGGDEGLDLGDCVFEEDSVLDLMLIPRVAGKVRLLRDGSDRFLTVVPGLRPVLSEEEEGIVRADLVSPQQEDSVRALQALYGESARMFV